MQQSPALKGRKNYCEPEKLLCYQEAEKQKDLLCEDNRIPQNKWRNGLHRNQREEESTREIVKKERQPGGGGNDSRRPLAVGVL